MTTNRQLDHSFPAVLDIWKGAKFAGSVGHPVTKMLSASGAKSMRALQRVPGAFGPTNNRPIFSYLKEQEAQLSPRHRAMRRVN